MQVYDFDIEMAPAEHMIFFTYVDRPGIIGKVGTILGGHGVNIATMDVGRKGERGDALMCLTVDAPVPSHVLSTSRRRSGPTASARSRCRRKARLLNSRDHEAARADHHHPPARSDAHRRVPSPVRPSVTPAPEPQESLHEAFTQVQRSQTGRRPSHLRDRRRRRLHGADVHGVAQDALGHLAVDRAAAHVRRGRDPLAVDRPPRRPVRSPQGDDDLRVDRGRRLLRDGVRPCAEAG